jgi:dienelactone hydrolase
MSRGWLHGTVVVLMLACGAGSVQAGEKCRQAPLRTSAEYLTPGPYPVGRATFTFVDASRPTPASGSCAGVPERTIETDVWFPATSAGGAFVEESGAPYPLVVHSHGLLDFPRGEEYLSAHLASYGYVVAAPAFPRTNLLQLSGGCIDLADIENQPGDVSFVIDSMLAEYGDLIDPTRIGASGLSFGGTTTLLVTYHAAVRDPRIKAALPIAPGACMVTSRFFKTTDTPLLLLAGTSDALVPYKQNAKRPFRAARAPKALVSITGASHTGFAGPLVTHSGTPHPDTIGCAAIGNVVPDDPDADPFAGLEGKEYGIVSTPMRCPLPCQNEPLPPSALPPAEQQDLTKIAGIAFFEGVLRDDIGARCFLRETFAAENDAVAVRAR